MIKFLIIRFSSIGDIVLTTPVIRCLKQQMPNSQIHYLTKKQFAPILESNTYIDKVHVLPEDISQLEEELLKEDFDHIIDLHNNLRTLRVKRMLRLPSYSFNKLNIRKWLFVQLGMNFMPHVHIVDRYMQTLQIFDIENDQKGLDYFIPQHDEVDISTLPSVFLHGFGVFVIGANHATKKLTTTKIAAICDILKFPVILLGGPDDQKNAEEICSVSKATLYNACGKYKLYQSASLVKQANVVLTHDTGLMHIAAAFHKKIISLWGNTVPDFGMFPYLSDPDSKIFEVKKLACRPCSKIGFKKCPRGHFKCTQNIVVSEVAAYTNRIFTLNSKNEA